MRKIVTRRHPSDCPHLAAARNKRPLSVDLLIQKTNDALPYPADVYIIEGVGRWHVPLNDHETMADYVSKSLFKVLLVVLLATNKRYWQKIITAIKKTKKNLIMIRQISLMYHFTNWRTKLLFRTSLLIFSNLNYFFW